MNKTYHPGCRHQPHTELNAHDGDIVEGPGDGYVMVIDLHREQGHDTSQKVEKEDLSLIALVGDSLLLSEEVHQHLWGRDWGETDVYDCPVSQQKIHGCVEPGIRGHCEHGEVVSHDSGGTDQQEHQKQEELELLSLGELQDKFWFTWEIPWFHGIFSIHLKKTHQESDALLLRSSLKLSVQVSMMDFHAQIIIPGADLMVLSLESSLVGSEIYIHQGLPRRLSGKESACQCRRHRRGGFNPCVGKIPRRRKWPSTPVFLPEKSHRQRSLAGHSPWGQKESDMIEQLNTNTSIYSQDSLTLSRDIWDLPFKDSVLSTGGKTLGVQQTCS